MESWWVGKGKVRKIDIEIFVATLSAGVGSRQHAVGGGKTLARAESCLLLMQVLAVTSAHRAVPTPTVREAVRCSIMPGSMPGMVKGPVPAPAARSCQSLLERLAAGLFCSA